MKIKYLIGGWLWFILISGYCYALDRATEHPGIYHDSWYGEYKNIILGKTCTMTIDIEREGIFWEINGKTLEPVEYEYLYSKLLMSKPFLCVYAQDKDEQHVFCGIIHETVPFYKLIGLYEYSIRQANSRPGLQGKRRMVEIAVELIGRESESR